MRNMSFMLTTEQVRKRIKTVTRRMGWLNLKVGEVVCAVEKSQGLGPGGKIKRLCQIEIVNVRREPLQLMSDDPAYGRIECSLEGFPHMAPCEFIFFFCASHKPCGPSSYVTRIEFKYVEAK